MATFKSINTTKNTKHNNDTLNNFIQTPSKKFNFADIDTASSFKGSSATTGGSLATRICLLISKMLSSF